MDATQPKRPLLYLLTDTETTDKYDFQANPEASHQPKLVQLGAMLVDDSFRVHAEINFKCRQDFIAAGALATHGITVEDSRLYGFDEKWVLETYDRLAAICDFIVCFNCEFDCNVIRAGYKRLGVRTIRTTPRAEWLCVMREMTPICKLPKKYRGDPNDPYKFPNLNEAYKHVTGKERVKEGQHDAMQDIRDTLTVFKWLMARAAAEPVPAAPVETQAELMPATQPEIPHAQNGLLQ